MKKITGLILEIIRRVSRFPFYPLLVGVYAVFFLWSVNVGQVVFPETLRSLAVLEGLSLVVFLACLALLRRLHKAALISVWLLAVLFLYGHLFTLVDGLTVAGLALGRHRYFIPLLVLLSLVFIVLVLRAKRDFRSLSPALNLLLVALILFSMVPIVSFEIRYGAGLAGASPESKPVTHPADPNAPDVYYLISDGYARTDELATVFNYDNGWFIDGLKKMGFYIPDCTFSNYITTTPSLSSSMNMNYLEDMGVSQKATIDAYDASLSSLMNESEVRHQFEDMGYKLVAFRGYIPALNLRNADYYYNYEEISNHVNLVEMHTFERVLMRTSILRPVVEDYEADPESISYLPAWAMKAMDVQPDMLTVTDTQQQAEEMYTFDVLPTLPDLPGKKLVYGHIYATHFPYLIDANGGSLLQNMHYGPLGYVQSVEYTSKRLLDIIQTILQKSKIKPIIILQGDHGQPDQNGILHNEILNAYYFPDGDYSRLYSTITPVNSFRVVLDQFFNRNYPLLADTLLVKDTPPLQPGGIRHIPAACGAH